MDFSQLYTQSTFATHGWLVVSAASETRCLCEQHNYYGQEAITNKRGDEYHKGDQYERGKGNEHSKEKSHLNNLNSGVNDDNSVLEAPEGVAKDTQCDRVPSFVDLLVRDYYRLFY